MHLYNTLTRKKEKFVPIKEDSVSMYHCGPTVYDYAHIGNLRSYVMADILRRIFEYKNYKVTQVMNITDVGHLTSDADEGEDKMTLALKRERRALTLENMKEVADKYTAFFKEDLKKLNILKPHEMPRASEEIDVQVALIKRLEDRGLTYRTSDGVYFDTQAYPDYGKLAGSSNDEHKHPRIGANKEKKNHRDFALWKFNNEIGFESEIGKGFPGWHIECSAMSMKYLGETFDIHTGGIDHIGTHHTNEMAQSEAATGKPFVHYWLHNEFVSVNGEKMSKSKGNIITLKDFEERGIDPLAYRYWLLTAHYRTPVNFTWEALKGAKEAIGRLGLGYAFLGKDFGIPLKQYLNRFEESIENDMNTPQAVAIAHELLDEKKISATDKKSTLLKMDSILGFNLSSYVLAEEKRKKDLPEEVRRFAEEREAEREQAKKTKNWKKSDELREKIRKAGYEVIDFPDGQRFYPFKQ